MTLIRKRKIATNNTLVKMLSINLLTQVMIAYTPAKINIGLQILNKRPDGFHNIHSYFYPVPLYDLIEFKESQVDQLVQSGWVATSSMEENLVFKALVLLRREFEIPPLKVH